MRKKLMNKSIIHYKLTDLLYPAFTFFAAALNIRTQLDDLGKKDR
jgi:hypothetical protein